METLDATNQVTYRQAVESDLPVVAAMYDKLDQLLRQHPYHLDRKSVV